MQAAIDKQMPFSEWTKDLVVPWLEVFVTNYTCTSIIYMYIDIGMGWYP